MIKQDRLAYCFIIPVYNHPDYLHRLIKHLDQFNLPIILINDGSDQACSNILAELAAQFNQITLIEHQQNQGKGQAVISGLRQAHAQQLTHALQIDADGQHDWNDITQFIHISQQNPKTMVIGQPLFDLSVPKSRLYGRYATHIWVWINSLSLEIKDSMCGFRVYPLQATIDILNRAKFQPRMGFDSEILVRLKWDQVKVINVPTKVIYHEQGTSHFHLWRDNIGMTVAHTRLFAGMLLRLPKLLLQKIAIARNRQGTNHDSNQ